MATTQQQLLEMEIPEDSVSVVCSAPVNIAVIKYWGKRSLSSSQSQSHFPLLVPINSSLSAAIHQDSMKSLTTIIASRSFSEDVMELNGKRESIAANPRLKDVIASLRKRAKPLVVDGAEKISSADWANYKLHIHSVNNFPTAAGLASSASGYACFTACLAKLYGVEEEFVGELSTIARQGSGSACRSMYGGWVAWDCGSRDDGRDSIARLVQNEQHWPSMRVMILVANSGQKETSSTDGMQRSVQTSLLLAHRASSIVPARMREMESYIASRNFAGFAELTMKDSNQFHATCLDTYPPIFYMNDTSKAIIHIIHAFNAYKGATVAAYTFDAGPNAVIFCLDDTFNELLDVFLHFFPKDQNKPDYLHDPMQLATVGSTTPSPALLQGVGKLSPHTKVYQVICSKVGDGPRIIQQRHSFK